MEENRNNTLNNQIGVVFMAYVHVGLEVHVAQNLVGLTFMSWAGLVS